MEFANNSAKLAQLAHEFNHFFEGCPSSVKKLDPSLTQSIKNLQSRIKRGYCLNMVACGTAKAGKSTLLNYLLAADTPHKLNNLDLLPTDWKVETSTPWHLVENRDISLDTIHVSHITTSNKKENPAPPFKKISEAHNYLVTKYSREAIEKLKKQGYLKPYSIISLSFGMPFESSSQLFSKDLFESAFNIVDLQGFNEPGADTTMKMMLKPFIFICCFDESTQFLSTNSMEQLLTIIKDSEPAHIIFIATHIGNALNNMMKLKKAGPQEDKEVLKKQCFDELKKMTEEKLNEKLKEKELQTPYNLYFFDPDEGLPDEAQYGVQKVRSKLVDLRKELNLEQNFCREMSDFMHEMIKRLRTELLFEMLIKRNPNHKKCFADYQKETAESKQKLADSLYLSMKSSLKENLVTKITELAQKRKHLFMEKSLNQRDLVEKLNNWVSNDGLQLAISEIMIEKVEEFDKTSKKEDEESFKRLIKDLKTKDEIQIPSIKITDSPTDILISNATSATKFLAFPGVAALAIELGTEIVGIEILTGGIFGFFVFAAVTFFALKALIEWANTFKRANFDEDLKTWSNKFKEDIVNEKQIKTICEPASKEFLKKWKEENQSKVKMIYLSPQAMSQQELNALKGDLEKKKISLDRLNEIDKEFVEFRDCLGE